MESCLSYLLKLQEEIASLRRPGPIPERVSLVAGVDVSYSEDHRVGFCSAVLLSWPHLKVEDVSYVKAEVNFPYIPGFLSFREVPLMIEAISRLSRKPQLVFVDGQGIAHPRECGLAVHLGVELGISTLGCAKKPLIRPLKYPSERRGDTQPIFLKGKLVGYVVRTKDFVKPVFVSPGHLISCEEAVEFVLKASCGFRIPEPLRLAHKFSNEYKNSQSLFC